MSRPKGQYIGQSSGIHSIQEKDDIFETDIDNQGGNRAYDKNRDFAPLMSLGKLLTLKFILLVIKWVWQFDM